MFLPIGFNLPFFRFPFVTMAWTIVSVSLFFILASHDSKIRERPTSQEDLKSTITYQMAFIPSEHSSLSKYFSYQFAHASFGHLLSNMWYLAVFGWILENALGSLIFLAISLVLGAVAVWPEFIFQADPTIPIVGASGSVAVMMGAAVALFPKSKVRLLFSLIPLPSFPNSFFVPLRYLAYFWLTMQVSGMAMNVWVQPRPIAYATHIFGFILGLGFGFFLRLRRQDRWLDIELSGRDLRNFYSALEAFHRNESEKASDILGQLSQKWPWVFTLQLKLFQIALAHRQRDLASKIWRSLSTGLIGLRRFREAEWCLESYLKTFGKLPPLELQERVLLTRLLREHISEDSDLGRSLHQAQAVHNA